MVGVVVYAPMVSVRHVISLGTEDMGDTGCLQPYVCKGGGWWSVRGTETCRRGGGGGEGMGRGGVVSSTRATNQKTFGIMLIFMYCVLVTMVMVCCTEYRRRTSWKGSCIGEEGGVNSCI